MTMHKEKCEMLNTELFSLRISDTKKLLEREELSVTELIAAYLDRIGALNPKLNCYLTITGERALQRANELDSVPFKGPLHGIPIAIKDNIEFLDVRTTVGSPMLVEHIAKENASVVEILLKAGAVIIGKLHMHEWALGGTSRSNYFGDAHNPWDLSRSPGGSSGGAGAATAASMALATLGTDTGGSVRIPASLNGVCGLRPTHGRISKRGVIPLSWTFDTVGPLARRVEDLALLLRVLSGYDEHDPSSLEVPTDAVTLDLHGGIKGLRIGLINVDQWDRSQADVAEQVTEAASILESLGADIELLELEQLGDAMQCARDMVLCEAAASLTESIKQKPEGFSQQVLELLRRGLNVSGTRYARAREMQRSWQRSLSRIFEQFDLLASPTCAITAPTIEGSDEENVITELSYFTYPFSLARVPALSMLCGFDRQGLPVGIQLIAKPWRDALLLRAAYAYEEATTWHARHPNL
jgi:aspartyl-tRNA(Asn)/glutamyl-tRNA(Gln) amidotransferase subunit A